MEGKRALITGITGQDGSILAEQLLDKGYTVYGLVRRLSTPNLNNISGILSEVTLLDGDLMDQASLNTALVQVEPDEIYNLAAQSFVGTSFTQPVLTGEVTGMGVVRLLEAMRVHADKARLLQASSSEMFGKVREIPQTELTPFHPRSPYGAAKAYAHYASVNYREAYGLFIANSICYNHESTRRGKEFVTRKIAMGVAAIKAGKQDFLTLGNLTSKRDWGYAPEYTDAMWRMLQHRVPDDFVIATGETHSVLEFVEEALSLAGVEGSWPSHVQQNGKNVRPAEVDLLIGDASKAKRELRWEPKVRFKEIVRIMVEHELRTLQRA